MPILKKSDIALLQRLAIHPNRKLVLIGPSPDKINWVIFAPELQLESPYLKTMFDKTQIERLCKEGMIEPSTTSPLTFQISLKGVFRIKQ